MNNDTHDIVASRIESANAKLERYSGDGVDTIAALTILESKKDELKYWSKKFSVEKRHKEIFQFVKNDNPNLNEKIINRYITWNMRVMPESFWSAVEFILAAMVFIGIPALVTAFVYFKYLIGVNGALGAAMGVFLVSFLAVVFVIGFICSVCTDK